VSFHEVDSSRRLRPDIIPNNTMNTEVKNSFRILFIVFISLDRFSEKESCVIGSEEEVLE
jgi:hypothetical protein